MVKFTFLGTGEAFDPERFNSSYLIEIDGKSLMVDCGADSFKSLMKYAYCKGSGLVEYPDGILITHDHGDHLIGVPAIFMAMNEEVNGIVGSAMIGKDRVVDLMSANPHVLDVEDLVRRSGFGNWPLFQEKGPTVRKRVIDRNGDEIYGMKVRAGETIHSVINYAYRFELPNGKSFAISGDGNLTDEGRELFRGVDYLIHEGYRVLGDAGPLHGSAEKILDYAIEAGIKNVGIVHMNREQRKRAKDLQQLFEKARVNGINLFFPNDHDELDFS